MICRRRNLGVQSDGVNDTLSKTAAIMEENVPQTETDHSGGQIRLPDAPVLVVSGSGATWLTSDGEIVEESLDQAARSVAKTPPLLVHRLATSRKLGINPFTALDILELFAFARPATVACQRLAGLPVPWAWQNQRR